jgi:hypothetical protein
MLCRAESVPASAPGRANSTPGGAPRSAEGSVGGLRIESDFDLHSLAAGYARDPDLGCVAIRRVTCAELMRRASADSGSIRMSPGQPGVFLVTLASTDRGSLLFLCSFLHEG